jgi:hypothetical protein
MLTHVIQWSEGTKRKLRSREFRFEVVFETPVLFLSPPSNQRGPIEGRPINYITGTEDSYKKAKVLRPIAQKKVDEQAIARVHTADDERASWVNLLSILQRAEEDSRNWDMNPEGNHTRHQTPNYSLVSGLQGSQPIKTPDYTLVVGVQGKIRSWDFMPASITKVRYTPIRLPLSTG